MLSALCWGGAPRSWLKLLSLGSSAFSPTPLRASFTHPGGDGVAHRGEAGEGVLGLVRPRPRLCLPSAGVQGAQARAGGGGRAQCHHPCPSSRDRRLTGRPWAAAALVAYLRAETNGQQAARVGRPERPPPPSPWKSKPVSGDGTKVGAGSKPARGCLLCGKEGHIAKGCCRRALVTLSDYMDGL